MCVSKNGTLLNVMWQPGWEGSLGENGYICVCMAESLCYPPEITTTLLIRYTPIQTIKLKKKKWYIASLLDLSNPGCCLVVVSESLRPRGLYGLQPTIEASIC